MYNGFVVDFTFNESRELKILELGDFCSATAGFDVLHPDDNIDVRYNNFLKSKLGSDTYIIRLGQQYQSFQMRSLNDAQNQKLNELSGLKYSNASRFYQLVTTLAANSLAQNVIIELERYAAKETYKDDKTCAFISWSENNPNSAANFILTASNSTFFQACNDKKILDQFLQGNPLYPATLVGQLDALDCGEINNFLASTASTHYVLKPTDQSCGRGVVVLTKEEVHSFLTGIQTAQCSEPFWKKNPAVSFLLQVCHPSKCIKLDDGKSFRPTGRLIFATNENNKDFTLLGAYWKLPEKASDEQMSLSTDALVSRISSRDSSDKNSFSTDIDEIDLAEILNQFNYHFQPVYSAIIEADKRKYAHHYPAIEQRLSAAIDNGTIESAVGFCSSIQTYDAVSEFYLSQVACLLCAMPWNIVKASKGYPINSLAYVLNQYYKGFLTVELTITILKNRLTNEKLKGFVCGFSMEDVTSTWFNAIHYRIVQKKLLSIDEARNTDVRTLNMIEYQNEGGAHKSKVLHASLYSSYTTRWDFFSDTRPDTSVILHDIAPDSQINGTKEMEDIMRLLEM